MTWGGMGHWAGREPGPLLRAKLGFLTVINRKLTKNVAAKCHCFSWQKMSLQKSQHWTNARWSPELEQCPYWIIDLLKRDCLSQYLSPSTIYHETRLQLELNYGSTIFSPPQAIINYVKNQCDLGHSMTWDKSGILRAAQCRQWLGPSQVNAWQLYNNELSVRVSYIS